MQNFTTSTEKKIEWLLAHRELWEGIDISYSSPVGHRNYMYLFAKMRSAGLYSEKTGANDARLERLVAKAMKRETQQQHQRQQSSKEQRNGRK